MKRTNSLCVNAGKLGYGCVALNIIPYGCPQGVCPFFKSIDAFTESEKEAKKRCNDLGYPFTTRDQVLDSLNAAVIKEKRRKEAEKRRGYK